MTYQVEHKSVFSEDRWSLFCELADYLSARTVAKALIKLTNIIRETRVIRNGEETARFDHEGTHYPEPTQIQVYPARTYR